MRLALPLVLALAAGPALADPGILPPDQCAVPEEFSNVYEPSPGLHYAVKCKDDVVYLKIFNTYAEGITFTYIMAAPGKKETPTYRTHLKACQVFKEWDPNYRAGKCQPGVQLQMNRIVFEAP
jgi:hypothetical protein